MGIMPDPVPNGSNCNVCFPAGSTPQYLKVCFAGIQRGEFWNPTMGPAPNGYHDVKQSAYNPCFWITAGGPINYVSYAASPYPSKLYHQLTMGIKYFVSTNMPICSNHFTNSLNTWAGNDFYGGTGYVITPMSMAAIIEKITPLADPDPRMELFPMAYPYIVVRYAGKRDATLCCLKVDTSKL